MSGLDDLKVFQEPSDVEGKQSGRRDVASAGVIDRLSVLGSKRSPVSEPTRSQVLQGEQGATGAHVGQGAGESFGFVESSVVRSSDFWDLIAQLRTSVSKEVARRGAALGRGEREVLGGKIILEVLNEHNRELIQDGVAPLDEVTLNDAKKALFNAVFRLGRLQPLIERTDVENIEIYGFDKVLLQKAGGALEEAGPVAQSDADLIAFLQFLATRNPADERPFSPAKPTLEIALPEARARLAAVAWYIPRPRVTIRLQHLKDVSMKSLVANGTMSLQVADFLSKAVRVRKNIVVSGAGQGSGKTTLLRALAKCIDSDESIATIETDYELYLHEDPHFSRVFPLQERLSSGEAANQGGQITASDWIRTSLRHNIDRVIVGEVRGSEILAMFTAMQAGNGSLSTVHADSAFQVPDRLATLALEHGDVSEEFAKRMVGQSINLVVFVSVDRSGSSKRRFVSHVIETVPGENGQVGINEIFGPDQNGEIVKKNVPSFNADLKEWGER